MSAAIVLTVARLVRSGASPTCFAAIGDREIYAGLLARHLAWPAERRLQLHLLNLDDLAASAILDAEPPPAVGGHVVVVGLGDLGQAVIVELARRQGTDLRGAPRTVLTVVDAAAVELDRRLALEAPFLRRVCDVRPRATSADGLDEAALARLLADGPPPDRVYVCCDDDTTALRVGFRALRAQGQHPFRVVVCVTRGGAFSAAFHGDDRLFDDAGGTLSVLPADELMLRPRLIREGLVTERIARSLHNSYLATCLESEEVGMGSRPSLQLWSELPDDIKEANRDVARHVGEKLAAIGCILVPSFDPTLRFEYRDGEELRLARMEHERWKRERRSRGYVYGPERNGMTHPDLVEWDELTPQAQDKDELFVRELPKALAEAGFQVLRLATPG